VLRGLALSRKGAKSRTGGRKLRSTATKARKRVAHPHLSTRLQEQLEARTRELDEARRQLADAQRQAGEALAQQTATSEVLSVISTTTGNLQPVFDTLLANATRLCGAKFGNLVLREGGIFRDAAIHNAPAAYMDFRKRNPVLQPGPQAPLSRLVHDKRTIQVADLSVVVAKEPPNSTLRQLLDLAGARTFVIVPMLKQNELTGAIGIYRQEVRPFSDKQIELVAAFAKQAVIAIENARLLNELRESLQQQTATADVLKVISRSTGELEPVFQAMLEKAVRICEAKFGVMFRFDGDTAYAVAMLNLPPTLDEYLRQRGRRQPAPGSDLEKVLKLKQVIHTIDSLEMPNPIPPARLAGARTCITVPMLKEAELVGAIVIYRQDVRPFTDKQIALLTSFASQAVIAIENTRLLNELRQRTDDLSVALEHQTATGEILSSISGSITDAKPVFQAIVRNLRRLFGTRYAMVQLLDDDGIVHLAAAGGEAEFDTLTRQFPRQLDASSGGGLAMLSKQVVQFAPALTDPATPPTTLRFARELGFDSVIFAPMIRDEKVVGAVGTARPSNDRFDDRQVALIKAFADQAVIAIENARLFEQVQARTRELSEALEQQTATSEVLKVISSSPGELEPVFQAMLQNATRICEANFANLWLREGASFRAAAMHNAPAAWAEERRREPVVRPSGPRHILARLAETKQVVHVLDALHEEGSTISLARLAGARTVISVPMLMDDELIGAIGIYRQEVRPFTDKQIALVKNFAAQAVIAIENTRLLNELRESLRRQTATSEVLEVISSSPGDLEPIFEAMLENAVSICDARFGVMFRHEGGSFCAAAWRGVPPAYEESLRRRGAFQPDVGVPLYRLLQTKELVQTTDELAEPNPGPAAQIGGARSLIAVPMLKEKELIGAFVVYRIEVRPFTDKQVELVTNFAKQAVIAIENARLLNELRESLQQQTATADVLKVISRSTFDLQAVLDTLTESARRVCEADAASMWRPVGDVFKLAATFGTTAPHVEEMKRLSVRPSRDLCVGRALLERRTIHIQDCEADPEYNAPGILRVRGNRAMLGVPLLREGVPVGALTLTRSTVQPFTERQIELATTFADQAVIAIENVRLFNEVQDKTGS
jgi:GAF domain-containing protein